MKSSPLNYIDPSGRTAFIVYFPDEDQWSIVPENKILNFGYDVVGILPFGSHIANGSKMFIGSLVNGEPYDMDTTIAQQVKEGISSGLSDVSDLWALAGYSNPFSAGVAIVTFIDSIATIGVNLSSNSEIVSQITTIRYANFLITENKETLIERYNTLYTTLQLFKKKKYRTGHFGV